MEPGDHTSMKDFVREHRVHYEVEPEVVADGSRRSLSGLRLRLLATHAREKLSVPGCPACTELLDELRSFADRIVADAGAADRAESIPATRKLYLASGEQDSDEVAVTLRVRCDATDRRESDQGEDRCVSAIRERLAALGVARE